MTRPIPRILAATALLLCMLAAGCGDDPKNTADADVFEDMTTGDAQVCGTETCATDQGCCNSTCVDIAVDVANCGACGVTCEGTETCSDGECRCGQPACGPTDACCDFGNDDLQCIDVQADVDNCGACGNSCETAERCLNGTCACLAGDGSYESCDADELCCPGIGCRNLEADPTNCGACGSVCGAGELCEGGGCVCGDVAATGIGTACGDGQSCCGSPAVCVDADDDSCICGAGRCIAGQICCEVSAGGNIMETCVRPDGDPEHCGGCGMGCGTAEVCRGASCRCSGGFADCDMDAVTGCESALAVDVDNCGGCGLECQAGQVCNGVGLCELDCQDGLTDCDGSCIDIYGDERHCGACTATCPSGEVCDGLGQCDESCQVGYTQCGNSCFNVFSDGGNCGACGVGCSPGTVCDGTGQCDVSCQAGFTECAGSCWNLQGTQRHCGACGNACGAGEVCDGAGQCALSCLPEYTQCGGDCVDTSISYQHCGGCGQPCSTGELCIAGSCQVLCPAGQIDCNGTCTDPLNDDTNCGGCGRDCGPGGACLAGTCALPCAPGFEVCGGTCVNVQQDDLNCGVCGASCGAGTTCQAGACMPSGGCDPGLSPCQVAGTTICADTDSSPFFCGSTCTNCGVFSICNSGVCECSAGFMDCGGGGCTTNVLVDTAHCGACNNPCDAGAVCTAGVCGCGGGLLDCDGMPGCETNPAADLLHCGACNNPCGAGESCLNGTCLDPSVLLKKPFDISPYNDNNVACFIDSAGAVFCAGENLDEMLGDVTAGAIKRDADVPVPVIGLDGTVAAVDVSVGEAHACAVLDDGQAYCWGDPALSVVKGCSGCGPEPAPVVGLDGISRSATHVFAGDTFTCFIDSNGAVLCSGTDAVGQQGNGAGAVTNTVPTVVVGIDGVAASAIQLVGGKDFVCALLDDSSVSCWGEGRYGQMGIGSTTDMEVPTAHSQLDGLGYTVTKLAASLNTVCALLDTGGLRCWGDNTAYWWDDTGATSVRRGRDHPVFNGVNETVLDITGSGARRMCALVDDGNTWCWGAPNYCLLGDITSSGVRDPLVIPGAENLVRIQLGYFMALGQDSMGDVIGWGLNEGGMAIMSHQSKAVPAAVLNLTDVTNVSVGTATACALHSMGTIECWGSNTDGVLGVGVPGYQLEYDSEPSAVLSITDAVEVDVGGDFACARHLSGALSCWGGGDYSQTLPHPLSSSDVPVAALVFDGSTVSAADVDLGNRSGCAVDTAGAVWCWGRDTSGALGNGAGTSHSEVPAMVTNLDGMTLVATQVEVGHDFGCVRTSTGAVYCWGDNYRGKLGDGTTIDSDVPVPVTGIDGVGKSATDIAAGEHHVCAVLSSGAVECWGDNLYDQCGVGAGVQHPTPIQVTAIDGVGLSALEVSAGSSSSCARLSNGELRCWGRNAEGALGNDAVFGQTHFTPQVVDVIDGTTLVPSTLTTGDMAESSCAVVTDTTTSGTRVYCWGEGALGVLGNGGVSEVCTPRATGYVP